MRLNWLRVWAMLGAICCITAQAAAPTANGSWRLFKDSDGTVPKSGAVIEMAIQSGSFSLKAVQAGETVEDKGSIRISGRNVTVEFQTMAQGRQSGPIAISNDTLVLPFKMLSDGPGWSMWMRPAAMQAFLAKVPAKPAGAESMPALLARVQKVAEAFGNTAERQAIEQRAKARAGSYRGGAAEAFYAQGAVFFLKGYYREAWYAFARAAVLDPDNAVYLSNLAATLQEIGSISDARSILTWVTKNYPNLDPPFGGLGTACLALGDMGCARGAFTRAAALAPENGLYDYGLGKVLQKEGQAGPAQARFRAAWQKGYQGSGREGAR